MNRRLWTAAGWILALALLILGSRAWPLQWPWFALIGFAVSEEAIFLLLNKSTLSRRYWEVSGAPEIVLDIVTAAAMVALFGHLAFGWFR